MFQVYFQDIEHKVGSMPKIISPNHSGFIRGRPISQNVLLAQKLLNDMHKAKDKDNVMMKFDMSKTYDMVDCTYYEIGHE